MDTVLKVVPHGRNLSGDIIGTEQVLELLDGLEGRLTDQALSWADVSLLVLFDCKIAESDRIQHESCDSVRGGLGLFASKRNWHPPLIGTSVFGSFYAHAGAEQPEIDDGLLFVAVCSKVIDRVPVSFEITKEPGDRRMAGRRVLEDNIREVRQRLKDTLELDVPPRTVTDQSSGLIFTTGSGHIESKEFIDFKDCYAVGQELLASARDFGAHLFGGCSSNRTPAQSQCLYFSEDIGGLTHYRYTFRHAAVMAFLPFVRAETHLRHPYRHTKTGRLDIEFHDRDAYAEGRYFYIKRINGEAPVEFLSKYWDYTADELREMCANHTAIPSEPGAHLVTIASSLNRFDENAWPNVPIWLDQEGEDILLRLVRAEADDGNYYLMELKPEYLSDNASDLMAALTTGYAEDTGLLAFLCESRKYVLDAERSNAEAETMLAAAPPTGALVGVYINGEYSTGAVGSIGYHNYSQIGAILQRRERRSLPGDLLEALDVRNKAGSLEVFLSHASPDKQTAEYFADILEQELPGCTRWLDSEKLKVGDHLKSSIKAAIGADGQAFVVFISPVSITRAWVKDELAWALEQERKQDTHFIFPVVLGGEEVMEQLRALWPKKLVKYLDGKLRLHIHDYTREEIATRARTLAGTLRNWDDGREPPSGPFMPFSGPGRPR
jgi:TIR domain